MKGTSNTLAEKKRKSKRHNDHFPVFSRILIFKKKPKVRKRFYKVKYM